VFVRQRSLGVFATALALLCLPWPNPPKIVQAATPDPAARLQVVLNSIYIRDDQDWLGQGEFRLHIRLVRCAANPCAYSDEPPSTAYGWWAVPIGKQVWGADYTFNGSTGETVHPNRVMPEPVYEPVSPYGSAAEGVSVYQGENYAMYIGMFERDIASVVQGPGQHMGRISFSVDEQSDWRIGTHSNIRAFSDSKGGPGDFNLTFEIRRTALPDLRATSIELLPSPGGGENACVGVENVGQQDAGPWEVTLRIDGQDVPNGVQAAGRLPVGVTGKLCLGVSIPPGSHTLSAVADEQRAISEMDEYNNTFSRQIVRLAGDGPTGQPGVGQSGVNTDPSRPDLSVASVRVARNADGSGTCVGDSSNYVLAQVRNGGQAAAGAFAVRLAVNGNLKSEKVQVASLEAGAALDVKLSTDDLNDGSQQVKVLADGDSEVGESDESNNSREVTATCD
jgi:hypothetical protein